MATFDVRAALARGCLIPAHPLALAAARRLVGGLPGHVAVWTPRVEKGQGSYFPRADGVPRHGRAAIAGCGLPAVSCDSEAST
jgi:hypothetical protein